MPADCRLEQILPSESTGRRKQIFMIILLQLFPFCSILFHEDTTSTSISISITFTFTNTNTFTNTHANTNADASTSIDICLNVEQAEP